MSGVLSTLWEGLSNAFLMGWAVLWALVLGLAISALVQAWAPKERIQASLGGGGPRPIALATALGAASSSCSYAAIAIARSLFAKGASAASALAFQFASTNLVVELGAVIWVLIGWRFALAELVGGLVLIAVMCALLRLFVSPRLEAQARTHAQAAEGGGHGHHAPASSLALRERIRSLDAWSDVAANFRHDCEMLWKEVLIGFLLAGFIGLLGNGFFNGLFISHAPAGPRLVENVIAGAVIAVLSFVCSVGNIPLAAVLWSGGIGFGGVLAFVFADLIVLPIVALYRKYYGRAFALRIAALMLVAIVVSAVIVDLLFAGAGLVPHARPTRASVFAGVSVDYKLVLNAVALVVLAALLSLSRRHRAGASGASAKPACPAHAH